MGKILILDDDPEYADLLRLAYEAEGFHVVHLPEPPDEFIDIVAEEQPDFIHSDVNMPGIDGFDAMKMIVGDPRTQHVRFYFVSTIGQREFVRTGLSLGALQYFVKSQTSPKELAQWVKSVVESDARR